MGSNNNEQTTTESVPQSGQQMRPMEAHIYFTSQIIALGFAVVKTQIIF